MKCVLLSICVPLLLTGCSDSREVADELPNSSIAGAPREAMTEILKRHDGVRALFDNRWLHLFALDENGQMAWRYAGDLQWCAMPVGADRAAPLKMAV